ncbi:MAG: V-type ATPase 116kDa subunit family protein [Smithella sp.]|jgi:vacuolar-type H+-ATPase subunit I/STV1
MFVKSDIRKITIALEKVFYSEVYFALGRAGIIHLSRFPQGDSGADSGLQDEEALTRDIVEGTEYALNALQISSAEAESSLPVADKSKDAAFVAKTKKIIGRAVRLQAKIRGAREVAARHLEYIDVLGQMGIDPSMIKKARLAEIVFGTVENAVGDIPSDGRFRLAAAGNYVCGIALAADLPAMIRFLKDYGFTDKSDDVCPALPENLKKRMENLRRREEIIEKYLNRLKDESGRELQALSSAYRAYEEMLKVMRMSLFSARALFITGWMEIKNREQLLTILRGICGNRFIFSERKDPDAPVRLLNMRLFKPFELLVKTMGMPSNREIDPTPLAAITFVLMFGLMFGDLGQGLVIVLCGILLKKYGRKKAKEELAQAAGILIACGLSAAVCGLLYGSVFSSERIIPAFWFQPTQHIMKLFAMTILMGIVFILIGLFINIINSILNADYTEALLEKRGLAILITYAFVVLAAVNFQTGGRLPVMWAISAFVILPLILFSLRGVLGPVLFQSAKPESISEYIIETVMDIVEIALSMFANTISFIRVGAFALSHAGLSIVTYTLAGMADPSMKSVGAFTIIVIGNIFIIGFEGLICGIQSLRLEYYEFFGKFFQGEGVVFAPFTLKIKASEV